MSLWGLLEPQIYEFNLILNLSFSITPIYFGIEPKVSRLKGIYRIGPHNKDVISIIFGALLGDAHADKRLNGEKEGLGTRISFYQGAIHIEYLLYLHKILSTLGYCNTKIPIITTRLGPKGKILKIIRFSTWTYLSFNWIYESWYDKNIKRLPKCLDQYLNPLALAIWIMVDGNKVGNSLKLCTNSFTFDECIRIIHILKNNFGLKASIQSAGKKDQYLVYILKESMVNLRNIVSPYIIPEMKYKLN
jgi:ubiquinol-cytochrome c reductase cytochrome b subunit